MNGMAAPMDRQPGDGKVAVVGAGIMGRGIARLFAAAGYSVALFDTTADVLGRALTILRRDLDRSVGRGHIQAVERDEIMNRIVAMPSVERAVARADLVIEAVPEELQLKQEVFAVLDKHAEPTALLATNTSALSVTAIAAATDSPERVVGLHFFNPVHRMQLVEVVVGLQTAEATVTRAKAICEQAGKTPIAVTDRAGFAASRINCLIGNEAFYMLMEGVASAEDIDAALRLGLNHPMGPFELVDLVGLDTRLRALERMHQSHGERFRPCPLMVSFVEAGRFGRKSGHGVYRYDEQGRRITPS